VRYRFALAIAKEYALELEAALQYADEHPDEMQTWWEMVTREYGTPAEA
jgi:hypothetical protein